MENPKGNLRGSTSGIKPLSTKKQASVIWENARAADPDRPSMYSVVLLNDDSTPMDFVVQSLQEHFFKPLDEATLLMMRIHNDGEGICGSYTREMAETKVSEVIESARRHHHPLKCLMRKHKEK